MTLRRISLDDARALPFWRGPEALLYLMAAAMPLAFATWSALLNNFVIEAAAFSGREIGWLHTVREIPGFLAMDKMWGQPGSHWGSNHRPPDCEWVCLTAGLLASMPVVLTMQYMRCSGRWPQSPILYWP